MNLAEPQFVIEDAQVNLDLPSGLSLAEMTADQNPQSLQVDLGTLAGGESRQINWIIRGDQKGWYNLKADFTGILQPFGDSVYRKFTTKEPLHVWANEAMQMELSVEDYCWADEPYQIIYTLTNVSDAPVYNAKVGISEGENRAIPLVRQQVE
jgi:hypothetical protein